MSESQCPNRLWPFKAHKMEPRYDIKSGPPGSTSTALRVFESNPVLIGANDFQRILETLRDITYVGDVCAHCGLFVSRSHSR